MPPYDTIKKRRDFLRANRGKRYVTPGFILLASKRAGDDAQPRLGITVTKKIGNAVIRNRMKRRFRALAQQMLPDLGQRGIDYILIGRAGGIEREFAEMRSDLKRGLQKVNGKLQELQHSA